MVGILFYYPGNFVINSWLLLLSGVVLFFLIMTYIRFDLSRKVFVFPLILFFVGTGNWLARSSDSVAAASHFSNYKGTWEIVEIVENPIEKERSIQLLVNVKQVENQSCIGMAIVYLPKEKASFSLGKGDQLIISGALDRIKSNANPAEFDYAGYMRKKGVTHSSFVASNHWRKLDNSESKYTDVREFFVRRLELAAMSDKNSDVAKALLLGDKSEMDDEVRSQYAAVGASHILAVSGLHVGIVMLLFSFLFRPLKLMKIGARIFPFLILALIWLYAFMSGLSPSVMRASVMFSFIVIGQELQRDVSVYQSLLVSATVLLLIDPFILFELGFQLSYAAVLSIVFFQPKFYALWCSENWLIDKMWVLTTVSIAAQIGTFPLILFYFHQFPVYFLLTNFLVIPASFAILFIGLIYLMLCWIPYLSDILLFALDLVLSALNRAVEWLSTLPYAVIDHIRLFPHELVGLYVLIFLFGWSFYKNRLRRVNWMLFGSIILLAGRIGIEMTENSNKQVVFYVSEIGQTDVYDGHSLTRLTNSEQEDEREFNELSIQKGVRTRHNLTNNNKVKMLKVFQKDVCWIQNERLNRPFKLPLASVYYLNQLQYADSSIVRQMSEQADLIVIGTDVRYGAANFIQKLTYGKCYLHNLKKMGALSLQF